MFESLSEKFGGILDRLTKRGALSEADVDAALREVRRALLEADVALDVARAFVDKVRERAVGVDVIKSVTGEEVSLEDLGGARKQAEYGNIHHVAPDEKAAFDWVREYLSFMPSSCQEKAPLINPGLEPEITESDLELNAFMPDADNAGYDMHDIILRIFDDGDFLELSTGIAPNVITGLTRVDGKSVGVVANQPMFLSGALDADHGRRAGSPREDLRGQPPQADPHRPSQLRSTATGPFFNRAGMEGQARSNKSPHYAALCCAGGGLVVER